MRRTGSARQDVHRLVPWADVAAVERRFSGLDVLAVPEQEMLENGKKWDDLYAQITTGAE